MTVVEVTAGRLTCGARGNEQTSEHHSVASSNLATSVGCTDTNQPPLLFSIKSGTIFISVSVCVRDSGKVQTNHFAQSSSEPLFR